MTRSTTTCGIIAAGRLLLCALAALPAAATRASSPKPAGHGAEAAAEAAPTRTDLLDLGKFRLRGCRTTDREVFDIQFAVHLVLSSKTTESDFHQLEGWKNRLRDQAIIAVRSADPVDFGDPELRKIQRLILFRVKRLPTEVGIIGVYVTDFSLDEGETLADLMVPPVTPAAPKKPAPSGGH